MGPLSSAGSLQPLTGAQQNASGVPPIPTHCPSAAITDVSENMRAKIYALCCKMGECASAAHAWAHVVGHVVCCRLPGPARGALTGGQDHHLHHGELPGLQGMSP